MRHRQAMDGFDQEIRDHLAREVEENIARGMTPEEARRQALLKFGNTALIAEDTRAVWSWLRLEQLTQDIRYAWRALRRNPGFAAVAVTTLALGIGATTAIFSVVQGVLLRPLPYGNPDGLVRIVETPAVAAGPGQPAPPAGINAVELDALRTQTRTLSHLGVYRDAVMTWTGGTEPVRFQGVRLSPAVLSMLEVPPALGRMFDPNEEDEPVLVLAHDTWQRHFGGAPDIVGRPVTLDGTTYSVVAVMPPGLQFPARDTQFWIPTGLPTGRLAVLQRMVPIARVRPGASVQAARTEVTTIVRGARANDASQASPTTEFELLGLQDELVSPIRPALLVLAVAVGFVLLIACANVANLLLARGAARSQEIAVRAALGARRGRLVRQLLTESVMLAIVGGAAGALLASGGLQLLRTLATTLPRRDLVAPESLPRLEEIGMDIPILTLTLAVSLVTGMLFGVLPAMRLTRQDGIHSLGQAPAHGRTLGLLVVTELAAAVVLLTGAGLLIHSFVRLSSVNPGFNARNVLTFQLVTPPSRYSGPQLAALAEDLVLRLEAAPGIRAAGYAEVMPMVRFRTSGRIATSDGPPDLPPPPSTAPDARQPDVPDTLSVSQRFLDVMGVPLIAGRPFGDDDRAGRPGVVLVNRALARSGLLGPEPLGQRISTLKTTWEVVGVVDDVLQFGLDQQPVPQVFFDMRQTPAPGITARVNYFAVRTDAEPAAAAATIRTIVRQVDPDSTVDGIATMTQLVSNSVSRPRLLASLLTLFAAVAAALAAIGLYGVLAYVVARQTREIGIRMALGARGSEVMHLVLRRAAGLAAAGILIGLVVASALTKYLQGMLFGVTALDATTFALTTMLFTAVAMLAAYVPARRATKVDPLTALRCE